MKKFVKYPSSFVNAVTLYDTSDEYYDASIAAQEAKELQLLEEVSERFGVDIDISRDLFRILRDYQFWISEGYKKGISIENMYDYVTSRTTDNPKSFYYNKGDVPEELRDVLDQLGSSREAHLLVQYLAREDRKRYNKWADENVWKGSAKAYRLGLNK